MILLTFSFCWSKEVQSVEHAVWFIHHYFFIIGYFASYSSKFCAGLKSMK